MNPNLVSTLVLVAHWSIVAGLFLRVIMRRAPVGVSLAWLTVIATAPFVGAVLYLLMGERRLGRQRARRIEASIGGVLEWQRRLRALPEAAVSPLDGAGEPPRREAQRVLGFPALHDNRLEVLTEAGQVFDALVADIDGAQSSCDVCFYIWHEGGRTAAVVEALVRAAGRGVRCRALADAIGSRPFLSSASARRLREAGVELVTALPTGPLRAFFVRRDLRNHRKLVSIDQRVAYTGSLNLVDPRRFKQDAGVGEWVDAMVRLTGPAAAALDGVFAFDWTVETGAPWDLGQLPEAADERAVPGAPAGPGALVQVVPSGPDLRPEAIHRLLLTVIYGARRELVMTTPYFVPDEAILTALISAAHRGVAVTLVVPANNDSVLVRHASVAHYEDLAEAGVRIALYEGGLLHTKSLVVDGETSVFGSVNLDMRSLYLNFEISLFVYDRGFAARLRALQDGYLAEAPLLDLEAWRRRPALRRFQENLVRLIGPLL